jgi:hypothetical protein
MYELSEKAPPQGGAFFIARKAHESAVLYGMD